MPALATQGGRHGQRSGALVNSPNRSSELVALSRSAMRRAEKVRGQARLLILASQRCCRESNDLVATKKAEAAWRPVGQTRRGTVQL